ncbi:hypothetical protein ACLB2K_027499 [Fragaria x ananassa]
MQCKFADWRTEVNGSKVDENIAAAFDELTSLSRLNILKVFISDANCLPKVVGVEPKWINFDICISGNSTLRRKVSLVSNSSPVYTRALTLGATINALPAANIQGHAGDFISSSGGCQTSFAGTSIADVDRLTTISSALFTRYHHSQRPCQIEHCSNLLPSLDPGHRISLSTE